MRNSERLERRLEAARELLVPQVYPSDTERALRRFKDLGRRRRQRAVVIGVLATSAAAAAIAFFALRPLEQNVQAPVVAVEQPPLPAKTAEPEKKIVHFADGSHAELIKQNTELRVDRTSSELLELTLVSGAARIEVVPNPNRLFRVSTKHMRIEVLGTAFTVYEEEGDESITVHRGRVAVHSGKERYELVQGMTYRYDEALDGEVASVKPRIKKRSKARASKEPRAKWKQLAEEGQIKEAYDAMQSQQAPPVSTDVNELLLAADVARLTGHPREAAQFLETAVEKNRSDPNAVLAAFTLGRIYERELGQPRRAAEAYQTARSLAPEGSLAEDALVHEIECRTKAGESAAAAALAKEYVTRHPAGRKIERMRRISGNE